MSALAFEEAPQELKDRFKAIRKKSPNELDQDACIMDFAAGQSIPQGFEMEERCLAVEAFSTFVDGTIGNYSPCFRVYKSSLIPGLQIAPSLLPPSVQESLMSCLLHRDLVNQNHQTNLHLHHNITYPENGKSLFSSLPSTVLATPKDAKAHRPLTAEQTLRKKLRWMTLGGQYDWTSKKYPEEEPPAFPSDLRQLVRGIQSEMDPQAAIINLYSPGDTLSMHRDVAEAVDKTLVSISIGCECVFLIGLDGQLTERNDRPVSHVALRLRSGDVVFMTGTSRFAWHGVPKVIEATCPSYLTGWPREYPSWHGFMEDKRLNINLRQMREEATSLL